MNGHPVRELLGYRFKWKEETLWGFTSAGLKEVLRGVGDTATLVADLAERGIIRRGSANVEEIGGER